eukprot:11713767-Prorocentrum_lima.AAC.1
MFMKPFVVSQGELRAPAPSPWVLQALARPAGDRPGPRSHHRIQVIHPTSAPELQHLARCLVDGPPSA